MASLAEIRTIYKHATEYSDVASPTQAEIDAHALLDKIEAHLWRRARWFLESEENDPSPDKQMVVWAYRAMQNSRQMAMYALQLALGSTAATNATVAQILALSDVEVASNVDPVIPKMAQGQMLGR